MSMETLPKPSRDKRRPEPLNYQRTARPDDDDEDDMVIRRVKPRKVQIEPEEDPQPPKSAEDNDSLEDFIN